MVPRNGMCDRLGDNVIGSGLKNQGTRFSRARSRVIHARAAFEPPLKTLRAEIMHETGERRSSRGMAVAIALP
jgi:hypothetical protein